MLGRCVVIWSIAMAGVMNVPCARGEVPLGFEVLEITSSGDFHHRSRINGCGEIVFFVGRPAEGHAEIYKYDNGVLLRLTNNSIPDSFADINDKGEVVWMRNYGSESGAEVWMQKPNGIPVKLGDGQVPSINNHSEVVWYKPRPVSCAYEAGIYLFNGFQEFLIIDDGRSNQSAKLNDAGLIVWTSYDHCAQPDWTSLMRLDDDGEILDLPSNQTNPQLPDINNLGVVVWGDFDHVEVSDGTVTKVLGEGHIPSINDKGDIAFQRWEPYWVAWVYFNGEFYQISDDDPPFDNGRLDINNDGEVVWEWAYNGLDPPDGGIRFMRRVRNGDVDFDHDVDVKDYKAMPECLTGPELHDRLCECRFFDIRHDRNVDLRDYSILQRWFANPQYPGHGCCNDEHGPGCNDEEVEACVCEVNPACCANDWDSTCVVLIDLLGCGQCP